MSLKIESPRPQPVLRPAVTTPAAPAIAKGEPAPSATPGISDGFERATPGTAPQASRGSRFEGVGAAGRSLPRRLESSKALADNVVKFFAQDAKLQEVGRTDPRKAKQILQAAFQTDGLSARDARMLSRYAASQLERELGGSGPGGLSGSSGFKPPNEGSMQAAKITIAGGSRPGMSEFLMKEASTRIDGTDFSQFSNWGDIQKYANELANSLPLQEGDTKEALKAYIDLKIGEKLNAEGIDFNGKKLGGKIGSGQDGFEGLRQGGFAPGEPLEDLPQQLEPHRGALEKLTDSLLRDSKLDNDARLRKALWSELKKLPLQDDAVRREARQYLLEEFSLRQDRYTE